MDASSPDADRREVADVLLARARSDLRACAALADDHEMGDDVVGFHAQQAVEKALKVGLTLAGIAFPRTPGEMRNLVETPAFAELREQLDGRLHDWMAETEDPLLDGAVPLPPGAHANDPADRSAREPLLSAVD
jgi:hypothetical protein